MKIIFQKGIDFTDHNNPALLDSLKEDKWEPILKENGDIVVSCSENDAQIILSAFTEGLYEDD